MNFVYPEFLFALAAISVPIIIHLFNFRRFKRIYFSDIRFLKDVEIETKSRNQLRNLLILLTRILAIICLVLAFAQPVVPTSNNSKDSSFSSILIYVDNSFSMNGEGANGNLLDEAVAKAIEVASVYAGNARLRLLTNDFDPAHTRDLSLEEFKNEVASIQPSSRSRSIQEIISRAEGSNTTGEPLSAFLISDLQRNTSAVKNNTTDSLTAIYVIPIEATVESNIYIDSCWFSDPARMPEQPDVLQVKVRNSGTDRVENLSVRLLINGIQRSVGNVSVEPGSFDLLELPFTNTRSGLQFMKVELDDYPMAYDNNYYLSYSLSSMINIVSINGSNASTTIDKLFENQEGFNFASLPVTSFDYSLLKTTDLVICNHIERFGSGLVQELATYAENGGDVLVIPATEVDLASTNELLLALHMDQMDKAVKEDLKVERVNLQSAIYKNVFLNVDERIDLPTVQEYYPTLGHSRSGSERLMQLNNGNVFLSRYTVGTGATYFLSAPLKKDWTNFHRHALFVPTLYNVALNSVAGNVSSQIMGRDELISIPSEHQDNRLLSIKGVNDDSEFIPEVTRNRNGSGILVHGQVKQDGHYLLLEETDTIQPISFNYDRSESLMEFYEPTEFLDRLNELGFSSVKLIDSSVENMASSIREIHEGKRYWKLFVLLALLFLFFETLLIRIMR